MKEGIIVGSVKKKVTEVQEKIKEVNETLLSLNMTINGYGEEDECPIYPFTDSLPDFFDFNRHNEEGNLIVTHFIIEACLSVMPDKKGKYQEFDIESYQDNDDLTSYQVFDDGDINESTRYSINRIVIYNPKINRLENIHLVLDEALAFTKLMSKVYEDFDSI